MASPVVLIIAPPGPLLDVVANDLREAGCRVETATDGAAGERTAAVANPDVIVLPERLPDVDALEVCRRIRDRAASGPGPYIVLAPQESSDSPKDPPGSALQQLARGVGALVQRGGILIRRDEQLACGDLVVDGKRHRATIRGRDLHLTPTEFRLLAAFVREPGRVFSRQELAEIGCGDPSRLQTRAIDVHIKSIRQKLREDASLIETVHGLGYRLREPDERR